MCVLSIPNDSQKSDNFGFLGVTVDSLKLWLLGLQLVFSESWMRIDSWANI